MAAKKKKYYWLRLKENFFTQPKMKKLRKIAGGDTYTIIYLKMQLLSLQNEGLLYFEEIEDDFIEEIALTIDEEVENVRLTILFLIKHGLLEEVSKDEYLLPEALSNIGSESDSAERVRRYRNRISEQKALHCNGDVTICNTEIEKENKEKIIEIKKNINSMHEDKNIFMQLPLNTSELYPIYDDDIEEYEKLYPNVNIEQQIRNMKGWLDANPKKRKTKNGIKRFINSWLSREQDKPSIQHKPSKNNGTFTLSNGVETNNPFIAMIDESEEQ